MEFNPTFYRNRFREKTEKVRNQQRKKLISKFKIEVRFFKFRNRFENKKY